jgi:hypothetical protein
VAIVGALLVVGYLVLLLLIGIPLLVVWAGTRSSRPLLVLRMLWAGGLFLLAVTLRNPWLVGGAAMLLLWPGAGLTQMWGAGAVRLPDPGRRRRRRIDPAGLTGIWSRLLTEALAAREQFAAAVRRTPRGPLREQLTGLTPEVDLAVGHAYDRARRGADLDRSAAEIIAASRSSSRATQRWGRGWRPLNEDQRVVAAQRARDVAAGRLASAITEERAQLQVLVARLAEAACHAAELSVASGNPSLTPGRPDVAGDLVERLSALRGALAEASSTESAAS